MKSPSSSTVVPISTAGDQEDVPMTGAAVSPASSYEEQFVCLYTSASGIRYSNNGTPATATAPSKSLKSGERFFDFVPAGGSLSFFGASGTVEIIPFG